MLRTLQGISRQVFRGRITSAAYSSHIPYLDRASHRRRDLQWLQDPDTLQESEYIVYMKLRPVAESVENTLDLHLSRYKYEEVKDLLVGEENGALSIFLGMEHSRPLFLLGLSERNDKILKNGRHLLGPFISVKPLVDRPLMIYSRAILAWNYSHPYCSLCGSRTVSVDMGHKRLCSNPYCETKKSKSSGDHAVLHPRSDPATIMVVNKGRKMLLARKDGFPPHYISCIAGFVEPGESLEQAVSREVFEEVGLHAASVRYVMSEPWPFDSVLTMGCFVDIDENDHSPLEIDAYELSFADWFDEDEVRLMVEHKHPDWILPPPKLLSYRLINHWLNPLSSH